MKFLYMVIVVIFISGSFAFSQEELKDGNSFPKFIPYMSEQNNLQTCSVKIDLDEYWQEQSAHWLSVDPMANKYPGWSPYNYVTNNPIRNIDPNGNEQTTFIDEDGKVKDIQDGSNAVFKETGSGTDKHYAFQGFDLSKSQDQGIINVETVVEQGQDLNMSNPALDPIPGGATFCNFATQNIMSSLQSAGVNGTLVTGLANDMQSELMMSNSYQQVDYKTALGNAQNGGLSLYSSLGSPHGHVGTFSVGDNISKGEVANIGRSNGFMDLIKNNSKGVYYSSSKVLFFTLTLPK